MTSFVGNDGKTKKKKKREREREREREGERERGGKGRKTRHAYQALRGECF